MSQKQTIAILIPCYNEAITIASVVHAFQKAVPDATIYVYDNNSTDDTMARAKAAGAVVKRETLQGKGHVIRRMFRDIKADVYVMVDGDATYDAAIAPRMIKKMNDEALDMVVGVRQAQKGAYPPGHSFGNRLFNWLLKTIFQSHFKDIFSGYRVFSRRFVRSFPALSTGFDIETELSVYTLDMKLPVAEIDTIYKERPAGSTSKLRTYRDGCRILWRMMTLFKETRPFIFFGLISLILAGLSIGLAFPLFATYLKTGLVPRFPTAILSASLIILSFLSLTSGIILESLNQGRRELRRLVYLSNSGV